MRILFRVVCFILLSGGYISHANAIAVPLEDVYFNEKGTRGQHGSIVAACEASMPKNGWYSNPRGQCLSNWCSCFYTVSVNGGAPQEIEAQGWATRGQVCPSGMSQSGASCTGTPNQQPGPSCPMEGNPIDPLTGNKYQVEEDFIGSNGMSVIRYYNSTSKRNLGFGIGWSSTIFGGRLKIGANDILMYDPSGELETFSKHASGVWQSNTDPRIQLQASSSGYAVLRPDNSHEIYDGQGVLQSISYKTGLTLTYTFDEDRVVGVANNFGQSLTIHWKDGAYINAIDLPDGSTITYRQVYGTLTHVTYPDTTPNIDYDNTTYEYKYVAKPSGSLLTSINANGQKYAEWVYDWKGRAHTSRHYAASNSIVEQHTINFSGLDQYQNKVTVTNPLGKQTTYHFQEFQGKRKVTHYEGHASAQCLSSSKFTSYDSFGLESTQTDERGYVTKYVRNTRGLIEQKISGLQWVSGVGSTLVETNESQRVTTSWLQASPLVATQYYEEKDAGGAWVGYKLVSNSWLNERFIASVSVSDPRDPLKIHTTNYAYTFHDTEQNIIASITVDGPRTDVNDTSVFTYNLQGQLISTANALGHTVQYANFTATGSPQTITDSNGVATQLAYDPLGKLLTSTLKHPSGNTLLDQTTVLEYSFDGQVQKITPPSGNFILYEYDEARRLVATVDAVGNRKEYHLDVASNVVAENIKNTAGQTIFTLTSNYDELSRLRSLVQSDGQETAFDYDLASNLQATINPRNYETQYDIDALSRVTTITDAENEQTHYSHDGQNQITTVTDANGNTTSYTYNGFGDLIQQISPDTGTTTFTHDGNGNRLTATDANGVVTQYQYDALNRLTHVVYPAAPSENVTYTYDDSANGNYGIGRLTGIVDPSGSINFRYNSLGLIESKTYDIAGQNYSVAYAYDSAGRLTDVTYPSGRTVSYDYDNLGQLETISTQKLGGLSEVVVSSSEHMPFGPLASLTYGNGITQAFNYDLDYRVTGIETSGASVIDRDYDYDPNNNIEQITDNLATVTELFSYDPLDRLDAANGNYGDLQFDYDAVGNRLQKILTQGAVTRIENYNYAAASQQLESVDINNNGTTSSRVLDYDNAGNMIEDNKTGGTTTIQYNNANRPASALSVGNAISYTHNSLGQRTVKSVNGIAQHFHYDEAGQLIAVSDSAGNIVEEFIYFGSMVVAHYSAANDELYFAHNDHLNTVKALTDANGDIVWQVVSQTPFGEVVINEDPDGDSQNVVFNLRFPGQYWDAETETSYNYFRTYDPSLGRYVQSDPIGLEGGVNTYAYVGGNPIGYVDPYGLLKSPKAIYDDAVAETKRRFPNPNDGHWNGRADAFRHCLATCESTKENGTVLTWMTADGNEKKGDWMRNQNRREKDMDQWNNACGAALGKNPGSCAGNCMKALSDGVLDEGNSTGGSFGSGNGYWY